jgi:hypothetical protein
MKLTFIPFKSTGNAIGALYVEEDVKRERARAKLAKSPMDWNAIRKVYVLLKQAKIPQRNYLLEGMRTFVPQIAEELLMVLQKLASGHAGTGPTRRFE